MTSKLGQYIQAYQDRMGADIWSDAAIGRRVGVSRSRLVGVTHRLRRPTTCGPCNAPHRTELVGRLWTLVDLPAEVELCGELFECGACPSVVGV